MNALKHGLCSRSNVITQGVCAENQAEFDELLLGLMDSWEPVGVEELSLVQEIGIARWRLARARGCEAALISREAQRRAINARINKAMVSANPMEGFYGFRPGVRNLYSDPKRLEFFRAAVVSVVEHLEQDGFLPAYYFGMLREIVGEGSAMACFPGHRLDGGSLVQEVTPKADLRVKSQTSETEAESELSTESVRRDLVISDLKARLEGMQQVAEMWKVYEKIEEAQPISITAVDDQKLARLDRYETSAVRNMYLAISTLQKIQELRKQEALRIFEPGENGSTAG